MKKIFFALTALLLFSPQLLAASVINFEDAVLNLQGFNNGEPASLAVGERDSTPLMSGGGAFENNFGKDSFTASNGEVFEFTFWDGWSWSDVQDSVTPGVGNQYAAFPGGGANIDGTLDPGGIYAMTSSGGFIDLPANAQLLSLQVTNATFAAKFIETGDGFGPAFSDGDFLEAVITGYDSVGGSGGEGSVIGSATVSLADFVDGQRSTLSTWRTLDTELASFSNATSLEFSFNDSRNGTSTPLYLALDNIRFTAVPEPASAALLIAGAMGLALRRRRANQRC